MAFALTSFRAWPQYPLVATPEKGLQYAYYEFTAAASDVVVDLGDSAGAFWSDVSATDAGANALTTTQQIIAAASGVVSIGGPTVFPLIPVAAPASANEVNYTINNNAPVITLHSGDGFTSWAILVTWRLNPPNERGVVADYSA